LRGVWRENFERQLAENPARHAHRRRALAAIVEHGFRASCPKAAIAVADAAGQGGFRGFSTGSACTTGKEEPSHVLAAMHFKAAEAHRVLRFSSGWETNESDWDALASALAKIHGLTSREPV
jgi:cysteine sulfinate desulfinase/cysteine desulfurase-like protein